MGPPAAAGSSLNPPALFFGHDRGPGRYTPSFPRRPGAEDLEEPGPMASATVSAPPTISRWWRVAGGLSMNLALGSLYAWSVFVAPLEAQFGWKRTETSMAFTIAIVAFAAAFVVAGQAPGPVRAVLGVGDGRAARQPRVLHVRRDADPELAVPLVRRGRRARHRVRLRDADPGDGQVVPRPSRPGRRPGGGRVRRRLGDLRAALLGVADPALRPPGDVPHPGRRSSSS